MRALHPLLLLSAILAFADTARPCSFPEPSLDGPCAPAEGSTAVPTNARVVVRFSDFAGTPTITSVVLVDASGAETNPAFSVEGDLFIARPVALSPNMNYELRAITNDFGSDQSRIIPFTTAADDDTTEPTIDGALADPSYTFEPKAANGMGIDSCGFNSIDRYFVELAFPSASDDMGLAGFSVYVVDENGGRSLRETVLDPSATGTTIEHTEPGSYTYVVEAFDHAGNASSTNEATVVLMAPLLSCAATHVSSNGAPHVAFGLGGLSLLALLRRPARRRR